MEVKQKIHGVNRVGLSGAFGPSVCFMNQQTWVTPAWHPSLPGFAMWLVCFTTKTI